MRLRPLTAERRTGLLALGAFVGIGAGVGSLGVAWPSMRAALDRDVGDLGVLLVVVAAGYLAGSIGHGRIPRRIDGGHVLAAAGVLGAAGAGGFCAGAWAAVLVAAATFGVATGLAEAGLNTHVALGPSTRLVNLVHGGFAVGATLGPAAITAARSAGVAWQAPFVALALFEAALAVAFARTAGSWRSGDLPVAAGDTQPATAGPGGGDPVDISVDPPRERDRGHRRTRERSAGATARWATAAAFGGYVALETSAGQWGHTLLTDRGLGDTAAGVAVSAYWAALALGRFALGLAGRRATPTRVLAGGSVAGAALCVVLALGGAAPAAAALVALGAALSGIFPAMVAATPDRFGAAAVRRVMGWQLAGSSIGSGAGPGLAGWVAGRTDVAAVGWVLVALAAVMAVAHVATTRLTARRAVPARLATP